LEGKWFRFDDDDVTPFDPASIEPECFGGKVKKETKLPNGQVHTAEQEQFANALMLFYEKVKPTDLPPEDECVKDDASDENLGSLGLECTTGYDVFEPDVVRANETHQLQSFLVDAEFQSFLKDLLESCCLSKEELIALDSGVIKESWRSSVIEMLLSYIFDVMLYSSDCSNFNDWARLLEDILTFDVESAVAFVQDLARKTKEISSNWLRTYLLDCPDSLIRSTSLRIFNAAVNSSTSSTDELKALEAWSSAWKELVHKLNPALSLDDQIPMPCTLQGQWECFEDSGKIGEGASSLGMIVSFTNVLLEAMPRCWRFSPELCSFVRFLASIESPKGVHVLRRPMIEALIPARLIALIGRERLPSAFRNAFPGSSIAPEVANTQIRPETNPSAHVIPMTGGNVLNSSDINSQRGPCASDINILLEALGCLAGLPGILQVSIVRDADDMVRGRQRSILNENAVKALSIVFNERCSPGAPGLGQDEIEEYLRICGVDTGVASM
jgi:ubiquitin carboxyl-terminal hydrolase 9/24